MKRLFLIEETHLPQEKQLVEVGHLMNDQEQGIFKDAAISSSP